MTSPADKVENLARCLGEVASQKPDAPAIIAADIMLSYGKLWRIIRGFAARLQQQGVGQGQLVALLTRDLIASLAFYHASALVGARFVVIEGEYLDAVDLKPDRAFRTPDCPPIPEMDTILIDASWPQAASDDPRADGSEFPGPISGNAPFYLMHTSGTTGRAKFMVLSQQDVILRSKATLSSDLSNPNNRLCSLFPANSRPFFARANAALLGGRAVVDTTSPEFMQQHGVTLVCASPRMALDWLGGRTLSPRLPCLQLSGARLPTGAVEILLRSFERVEDVYGASETSKAYVTRYNLVSGSVASAGVPQDSEVQIVDSEGMEITDAGRKGQLRVRNPYMVDTYLHAPEASTKVFRNGWFVPGDLAEWGPARELLIAGRSDHLINLGGIKIAPEQIETVISAIPGIRSCVALPLPDETLPAMAMVLVAMQAGAVPDQVVSAAHAACSLALPAAAVPRLILVVDSVPLTADLSPRRMECLHLARVQLERIDVRSVIGHV